MNSSTKITRSRLLYADFISDENEEKEIVRKIKEFGFTAGDPKSNTQTKFSIGNINDFVEQLRLVCESDSDSALLDYIGNVVFWVYSDGILPLKVAIIEVILRADELRKLEKDALESKICKLSFILGRCFCMGPIPPVSSSKDFRILKFSSVAIPDVALRNFVAEFVIEAELKFFDNFNKELDLLEKEISIKDLMEQKIIEARNDGKKPSSKVDKTISKDRDQQEQNFSDIRTKIVSLEPVSFLGDGFSCDQSIVRGYTNEMFIIGKIVQGSLNNSTPLYLSVLSTKESQTPVANLESIPVLQFPGRPFLDFSFGAGQILALQLLNSWNRHVETSVMEITTKKNPVQKKDNMDADETLEELQNIISYSGINEKISVNYRRDLQDLANPSNKTSLYEFPMPPEATPYSIDPEQYGLEKPGPIVSNLASLILENLELNEKHLLDATNLRKSKIDVLKIKEDRKFSGWMLRLTIGIAIATFINVFLFFVR